MTPRIQHVTITVPDTGLLPQMERFYRGLGGIVLVRPPALEEDTPGYWFGLGETQLHIVPGPVVGKPAHFAVDLGDAYDSVLDRLRDAGVEVRGARDLWGGRRSFVHDPAGNMLEVFDRPPDSTPKGSA